MPERKIVLSNVLSKTITATDDNKFHLSTASKWFREGNFIVSGNAAKYGDSVEQEGILNVGSVLSFQDFDLTDIYFINSGAGANTVINFVGVVMTPGRMTALGIEVD
jgi:hypothetical protein